MLVRMARETMGRLAWRQVPGAEDRPIRNEEVREWMHLPTVESELRGRMLRRWAHMVGRPRDIIQVMAALLSPIKLLTGIYSPLGSGD